MTPNFLVLFALVLPLCDASLPACKFTADEIKNAGGNEALSRILQDFETFKAKHGE
jgi:hypothetical protein